MQIDPGGSVAPIGQHAISIVGHRVLLFDDGFQSGCQNPPGISRTFSAPRKYEINTTLGTALEVWNYPDNYSVYSPLCSSVYEDAPGNYLVDYATEGTFLYTEVTGLIKQRKVFDYQYVAPDTCDLGRNANIVHLENLVF